MRSMLRQFWRAPGRILASVIALALSVGAIGVLAVPTVSESTLHEAVGRDGLADIIVDTTPLTGAAVKEVVAFARDAFAGAVTMVADGGDALAWGLAYMYAEAPGRMLFTPTALGTLGVGMPFALAAKAARPDEPVIAVCRLLQVVADGLEVAGHRRETLVQLAADRPDLLGVRGQLLLLPAIGHRAK